MPHFRFEDLDIWKLAFDIANRLFDMADTLEEKRLFRFAEQLRGAGLSLTNNIAEGSGSESNKEFMAFLNYTRRSAFECANIILSIHFRKHISDKVKDEILENLDHLCRKIKRFKSSLN